MDNTDRIETALQDREFSVLLPALALLSCANHRAAELEHGFDFHDGAWILTWPDEVVQGFGVQPVKFYAVDKRDDLFRVSFEPCSNARKSYWRYLFGGLAPAIVVEYMAAEDPNSDGPPVLRITDVEWLHWPWHASENERLDVLDQAIVANEGLSEDVGWLALAEQAALSGQRSIFFTRVAGYLSR